MYRWLRILPPHFHFHRLPFTFPPLRQPRSQSFRKPLRRQPETRFHLAFGHRQRIVKIRRIRKIPHAELIQPFQRTRPPLSANHHLHQKFLRVHAANFSTPCFPRFLLKRFRNRPHYFAEVDIWPAAGVVRRRLCRKCLENPSVRVARECAARRFRLPQGKELPSQHRNKPLHPRSPVCSRLVNFTLPISPAHPSAYLLATVPSRGTPPPRRNLPLLSGRSPPTPARLAPPRSHGEPTHG